MTDPARSVLAITLGLSSNTLAKPPRPSEAFEQAFATAKQLGSPPLETLVISNLATAYTEAGSYTRAEDLLQQALRLSQATGSSVDLGMSWLFRGENYTRQGSYDDAIEAFERSLACSHEIGHRYMEGYALTYLAEALCPCPHDHPRKGPMRRGVGCSGGD